MDTRVLSAQLRRAIQLLLNQVEDEETLQEVATVAPEYQTGYAYKAGEVFIYGLNGVGDPQLYRVVQAHTSQSDWPPNTTASLYKAIGVTAAGLPIWAQPAGGHDAYAKGDSVSHKDKIWISDIDGNVWEPGVHGWSVA